MTVLGCFGSDNYSGVCPEVMEALQKANVGIAKPYGEDPYTAHAKKLFKKEFGESASVYFVLSGTAANVVSLSAVMRSFHSLILAETAHMHAMESGAIYANTGCKPLLIPTKDGKILPEQIEEIVRSETYFGYQGTLPHLVSISQSTELGTMYTPKEVKAIATVCKKNKLILHMDGCRLYNAAAAQKLPLHAFGSECGVDILSIGGTKNGLMCAEAILFFDPKLAEFFPYVYKQRLNQISKMRFLSVQFIPFLEDSVWKKNAEHANQMAFTMVKELEKIPGLVLHQKVETNQIFLELPTHVIQKLQKDFLFYVRDPIKGIVRLVTSFDTTHQEISLFIKSLKALL